eukprot:366389-Chlamydomonas_euryale.AAC.4
MACNTSARSQSSAQNAITTGSAARALRRVTVRSPTSKYIGSAAYPTRTGAGWPRGPPTRMSRSDASTSPSSPASGMVHNGTEPCRALRSLASQSGERGKDRSGLRI